MFQAVLIGIVWHDGIVPQVSMSCAQNQGFSEVWECHIDEHCQKHLRFRMSLIMYTFPHRVPSCLLFHNPHIQLHDPTSQGMQYKELGTIVLKAGF